MTDSIYKKLNSIQLELKAHKGQRNTFGKYNYRSCEDILEALKPLLDKYQAVINVSDNLVLIGDRYYIQAIAQIIDIDTGDKVTATGRAREEETKKGMDASQITGSTSSYARKYALNGLLAIDDTKDSDYLNNGKVSSREPNNKVKQVPKIMTLEDAKQIRVQGGQYESLTLWEVAEDNLQVLKEWFKIAQAGDRKDALKLIIDEKEKE